MKDGSRTKRPRPVTVVHKASGRRIRLPTRAMVGRFELNDQLRILETDEAGGLCYMLDYVHAQGGEISFGVFAHVQWEAGYVEFQDGEITVPTWLMSQENPQVVSFSAENLVLVSEGELHLAMYDTFRERMISFYKEGHPNWIQRERILPAQIAYRHIM